jgi:hypothetical protein
MNVLELFSLYKDLMFLIPLILGIYLLYRKQKISALLQFSFFSIILIYDYMDYFWDIPPFVVVISIILIIIIGFFLDDLNKKKNNL